MSKNRYRWVCWVHTRHGVGLSATDARLLVCMSEPKLIFEQNRKLVVPKTQISCPDPDVEQSCQLPRVINVLLHCCCGCFCLRCFYLLERWPFPISNVFSMPLYWRWFWLVFKLTLSKVGIIPTESICPDSFLINTFRCFSLVHLCSFMFRSRY